MTNTSLTALKTRIAATGISSWPLAIETTMTNGDLSQYSGAIAIEDNGEPLVELKDLGFLTFDPHPYQHVGAPYDHCSPTSIRQSVAERVQQAERILQHRHPGYRLKIFDAYRPLAVQTYMVDYTLNQLVQSQGLQADNLDDATTHTLMAEVLKIWAKPNTNPLTPPAHSTGAAVDLTIVDENGHPLDMGSEIDALGDVSLPNHFQNQEGEDAKRFQRNRELLHAVMSEAGFQRLCHEWWHFSYGDQMWVLLEQMGGSNEHTTAWYGRIQ